MMEAGWVDGPTDYLISLLDFMMGESTFQGMSAGLMCN